jgi:hypothetical protein
LLNLTGIDVRISASHYLLESRWSTDSIGNPNQSIAFERWYEFEPANATREILRQIGFPTPMLMASDINYDRRGRCRSLKCNRPTHSMRQTRTILRPAISSAALLGSLGDAVQQIAGELRSNGYPLANCTVPAFTTW